MSNLSEKKLILVIGATGAQGLAVIDALLGPTSDGKPSPYTVRALTRDPQSKRAKGLVAKGVECVEGSFMDFKSVEKALKGAYGAFVNTDGFTVGEEKEIFAGMKIFEAAKRVGTLRHYVYSHLDYSLKKGGYNLDYNCAHLNSKARVGEWMKQQPTDTSKDGMTWSLLTTGPYMEMLNIPVFGPLNWRADGTAVFATPIGKGHAPMIALSDIGFFARYSFDNRELVSGKDLEVASEMVTWDHLVETFKRVTGKKAVVLHQSMDEYISNFLGNDLPMASDIKIPDGSITWGENVSALWRNWRDDIITRDMDWVRSVNPNGQTVEKWMRQTGYEGKIDANLLKGREDGNRGGLNWEKIRTL